MDWLGEHWRVLLLLFAYGGVLLVNGRVGRARSANVTEYYVGGRNFGGLALGISFTLPMRARIPSSATRARAGLWPPWLLNLAFMLLFCAVSWWWVAPRVSATEGLGAPTLPEWFGRRFGDDRVRRAPP